ncbi:MAG: class B sortase [Lachnospiraceae bacterium]
MKKIKIILICFFTLTAVISGALLVYQRIQSEDSQFQTEELRSLTNHMGEKNREKTNPQAEKILITRNSDYQGWISVAETELNYPLVYRSQDNTFYLTHGYNKLKSRYGTPFIDMKCEQLWEGRNIIIYGHHMRDGTMFAMLHEYQSKEYLKKHPQIKIETKKDTRTYAIFAVVLLGPGHTFDLRSYGTIQTEEETKEYLKEIQELKEYETGVRVNEKDELLTLVTCEYTGNRERIVVIARRQDERERKE